MKRIATFITLCLLATPAGTVYADIHRLFDDMLIVAADTPKEGTETTQDMPMGQSAADDVSLLPEEGDAADELFGLEGGFFHPYLSVEVAFTDNLYYVDNDTTDNLLTTISPGIWFTLPRKRIIPIEIVPHNTAPGGLSLQMGDYEGTDKVQLYALAGSDLLYYSEDSDLNEVDLDFEGLARYNMASGLSLQILDRYAQEHDGFGIGGATEENQREYDSNLGMATVDWNLTEKFRFKADFSNFYLAYDESINEIFDRQDNSVDLYAYYKYSIKSSLFIEYKYTDVEYDTYTVSDNNQDFFYGGFRWDTTEKLSLTFKAGLQQKEFDQEMLGYSDSDNLTLDLQGLYRFTEKTEARLDLYRLTEESDSSVAADKEVLGVSLAYKQKFTDKIIGKLDLFYENADYNQLIDTDRSDDTFEIKPALQYLFKDWLMAELAYSFEMDDSTDDTFDYETNTFFMSLNFAL